MSALPYMPLYVADYLADTAHLSAMENGAYLMLIMNYWQRGKALPCGDAQLARIARLSLDEWQSIKPAISEFFQDNGNEWVHGRIESELNKVREKSVKASNAGKASAQRKINERSTDVEQTFNHTDTDTDTEADTEVDNPQTPFVDDGTMAALDAWNAMAGELKLPLVQRLTPKRKASLKARLAECGGADGWALALSKIRGSPFLRGQKSDWRANFDFLLQQSSFTKVMEGQYDASTSKDQPPRHNRPSVLAEILNS